MQYHVPIAGDLELPKMDGKEVATDVFLVGEPWPVKGTNKLHCLADVHRALCVVELVLNFKSR